MKLKIPNCRECGLKLVRDGDSLVCPNHHMSIYYPYQEKENEC